MLPLFADCSRISAVCLWKSSPCLSIDWFVVFLKLSFFRRADSCLSVILFTLCGFSFSWICSISHGSLFLHWVNNRTPPLLLYMTHFSQKERFHRACASCCSYLHSGDYGWKVVAWTENTQLFLQTLQIYAGISALVCVPLDHSLRWRGSGEVAVGEAAQSTGARSGEGSWLPVWGAVLLSAAGAPVFWAPSLRQT